MGSAQDSWRRTTKPRILELCHAATKHPSTSPIAHHGAKQLRSATRAEPPPCAPSPSYANTSWMCSYARINHRTMVAGI